MRSDVQTPAAKLGIALPVYNGANYIEKTLDSILGQTFTDFVLAISDNASTDRTSAICADYAKRDPRVRYLRNAANLGLAANTVQAYELAKPNEYCTLVGHDDLWMPKYAECLIEALESRPEASLAFSWFTHIDGQGALIRECGAQSFSKLPKTGCSRADRVCYPYHIAELAHGIYRSSCFDVPLVATRYGIYEDVFLIHSLAAQGAFVITPDFLFSKRLHGTNASSSREYKKANRAIDCSLAVAELRRRYGLTLFESVRLWANLVRRYRIERPLRNQFGRARRFASRILSTKE